VERIMSETDNALTLRHGTSGSKLTEAELNHVCGGVVVEKIGADSIAYKRPKTSTNPGIGPV
jgi:hypothetical protein